MPNLNDYHAFKSTGGNGGSGGGGCSNHPWLWIAVAILIVYLIGKVG